MRFVSLDEPARAGDGLAIKDTIPHDGGMDHFFRSVDAYQTRKAVRDILEKCLKPKVVEIISMHFGLFGRKKMTLAEVGKHQGLSRERVRQVVASALCKPALRYFAEKAFRPARRPAVTASKPASPERSAAPPLVEVVTESVAASANGNGPWKNVVQCPRCGIQQYLSAKNRCVKCGAGFEVISPESFLVPNLLFGSEEADPPAIGVRIKEFRQAAGLSQAALTRRSGVSRSYLSRIESRKLDPTLGILEKLATVFEIPLRGFFLGSPEIEKESIARDPFLQKIHAFYPSLTRKQRAVVLSRLRRKVFA